MAVGIEGQYFFKFKIQDREDFINTEDLILFKLCEEAGNLLPTFELCFTTFDEKILGLLHEGNDLQVSFGQERNSLVDIKLVVMRMTPTRQGANRRMVSCNGFFSALGYLNTDNVFISTKKSGIEVMKDIASKYFSTGSTFNVLKSTDSMNWVQSAKPDRAFINDLWMHSNLVDSFPAIGISSDGKFICKDIKKALKEEFKWRFTANVKTVKDIYYDGDYAPDHNTGFINNWVGYTREKTQYNLEAGTEQQISNTVKPVMSMTKEIAKRVEIEKRYAQAGIVSDNVHSEYWTAYLRNLSSLATLGAVKNTISFTDIFKPIRVLDLVMFKEDSIESTNNEASEYNSGLHFVTKVARSVQNGKFLTVVEMARESVNQLQGEFLVKVPTAREVAAAAVPTPPAKTPAEILIAELKSRFPGRF